MKAKRKPATKNKLPKSASASDAEFYRKLGEAYRDQESDISDLLTMAKISARASIGDQKGEAIFTAHHLRDMIDDFRQQWHDTHKTAQGGAA